MRYNGGINNSVDNNPKRDKHHLYKLVDSAYCLKVIVTFRKTPRQHKKILVIDDDAHTPDIMAIILENSGYEAISNAGQTTIKEIIAINQYLIIIDLQMPYRIITFGIDRPEV